jgi:hypothetical protein
LFFCPGNKKRLLNENAYFLLVVIKYRFFFLKEKLEKRISFAGMVVEIGIYFIKFMINFMSDELDLDMSSGLKDG